MKWIKKFNESHEEKWYEEMTEQEWTEHQEINMKQVYLDKLIQLGHKLPAGGRLPPSSRAGSFRPLYDYKMVETNGINHIELGMSVTFFRGSSNVLIYHCDDHYFLVCILWGAGSGFTSGKDYWKCDDWQGVEIFFNDLINKKIY
jgi:hypothetical protein